jgi:hypothetical protein
VTFSDILGGPLISIKRIVWYRGNPRNQNDYFYQLVMEGPVFVIVGGTCVRLAVHLPGDTITLYPERSVIQEVVICFASEAVYEHEQLGNGLENCRECFQSMLPLGYLLQKDSDLYPERTIEPSEARLRGFIVFSK